MLEVKILSDTEFDNLPYPEAKISLGLADTKTGTAFVRYTANDELNKYLIEHELEHLIGEDRDEVHHGGDGVYYKGFGNLFSGLGQAFQGAGQSIHGAASSIGQGVMGMFGGGQQAGQKTPTSTKPLSVQPKGMAPNAGRIDAQQAMPSAGPTMQGFSSMAPRIGQQVGRMSNQNPTTPNRITPPQPTVSMPQPMAPKPQAAPSQSSQAPMSNFQIPTGAMSSVSQSGAPMSLIPPSSPAFNPSASMANIGSFGGGNYGGGQPNVLPQTRPGVPKTDANSISVGNNSGKNLMDMFGGKTAIGAGLQGIGQFGIQTPDMPDINELPSVQQLRNFNFKSVSELDPALEQAINNDFQRIDDKEYQAFVARYKSLRPGADIESDSNFRRDLIELQRMQGARRADAMAKYRFEMIQQNLQMSQAELAQMQEMAQMDVQMIMGQMGLDYADAQKFKDTFSRLGDSLITQGLGIGQEEPVEQSA